MLFCLLQGIPQHFGWYTFTHTLCHGPEMENSWKLETALVGSQARPRLKARIRGVQRVIDLLQVRFGFVFVRNLPNCIANSAKEMLGECSNIDEMAGTSNGRPIKSLFLTFFSQQPSVLTGPLARTEKPRWVWNDVDPPPPSDHQSPHKNYPRPVVVEQ